MDYLPSFAWSPRSGQWRREPLIAFRMHEAWSRLARQLYKIRGEIPIAIVDVEIVALVRFGARVLDNFNGRLFSSSPPAYRRYRLFAGGADCVSKRGKQNRAKFVVTAGLSSGAAVVRRGTQSTRRRSATRRFDLILLFELRSRRATFVRSSRRGTRRIGVTP